ncbi:MAG: twin-arginine translocase TatA/TatE family subunit [Actinomycetota bacterium]
MLNIGAGELIVIALILLIAVGPEQLPSVIRRVGKTIAEVRSMTDGLRTEFMAGMEEIERATDPEAWAADSSTKPYSYNQAAAASAAEVDDWAGGSSDDVQDDLVDDDRIEDDPNEDPDGLDDDGGRAVEPEDAPAQSQADPAPVFGTDAPDLADSDPATDGVADANDNAADDAGGEDR